MQDPYPSAKGLERDFISAAPHTCITYHIGFLTVERVKGGAATLNAVAEYAMLLEQEGRADLAQRRLGENRWQYLLQKRATLGTPCDYERGAERAYNVLSPKEPPKTIVNPKHPPRQTLAGHLTPRQQHAIEREPYIRKGAR